MIAQKMITQSGLKSDRSGLKPGLGFVRGQARILLTSNRGYDRVLCVLAGLFRPRIFNKPHEETNGKPTGKPTYEIL